jgi:hypothetical protein
MHFEMKLSQHICLGYKYIENIFRNRKEKFVVLMKENVNTVSLIRI